MKNVPIVTLFFLMTFAACRKLSSISEFKPVSDSKLDTLRIYNLLPLRNGEGYLLYVNDSLRYAEGYIAFNTQGFSTKYIVPHFLTGSELTGKGVAGTFNLKIVRKKEVRNALSSKLYVLPATSKPNPDSTIASFTVNLPQGSGFENLVLFDSVGTVAHRLLATHLVSESSPEPGKAKIRVANFGYSMVNTIPPSYLPRVTYSAQIQFQDSSVFQGFESLPFSEITSYQSVDYGSYQFRVFNQRTKKYLSTSGAPYDAYNFIYPIPNTKKPIYRAEPVEHIRANRNNDGSRFFEEPAAEYSTGSVNAPVGRPNSASDYPLKPSGLYTLFIVGDAYTLIEDRLEDANVILAVAKAQFINADPNGEVTVSFSVGGKKYRKVLPFGSYTLPTIFPAEAITYEFASQGTTVYSGSARLLSSSNVSFYLSRNLRGIPFVFEVSNAVNSYIDFYAPNPPIYPQGDRQLARVSYYNLSADAGSVPFSQEFKSGDLSAEFPVYIGRRTGIAQTVGDLPFSRNKTTLKDFDGIYSVSNFPSDDPAPYKLNVRYSASRPDALARVLIADYVNPFPHSGDYSAVLIGLIGAKEPGSKPRIIVVPHSNTSQEQF